MRRMSLAVLVATSGCSYLLMQRAPVAARPGDTPDCSASNGLPYADLAIAAVSVLSSVAIYAGVAKQTMTGPNGMQVSRDLTLAEREAFGTAALVEGAGYALSGWYGTWRAEQCRDFLAKLAAEPKPSATFTTPPVLAPPPAPPQVTP